MQDTPYKSLNSYSRFPPSSSVRFSFHPNPVYSHIPPSPSDFTYSAVDHSNPAGRYKIAESLEFPPPLPLGLQSNRGIQSERKDMDQRGPSDMDHSMKHNIFEGEEDFRGMQNTIPSTRRKVNPPGSRPVMAETATGSRLFGEEPQRSVSMGRSALGASTNEVNAVHETVTVLQEQLESFTQGTNERFRKLYAGVENLSRRLTADEKSFELAKELRELQEQRAETTDIEEDHRRIRSLEKKFSEVEERNIMIETKLDAAVHALEELAVGFDDKIDDERSRQSQRREEDLNQLSMHIESLRSQVESRMTKNEETTNKLQEHIDEKIKSVEKEQQSIKETTNIKSMKEQVVEIVQPRLAENTSTMQAKLTPIESRLKILESKVMESMRSHGQHKHGQTAFESKITEIVKDLNVQAGHQAGTISELKKDMRKITNLLSLLVKRASEEESDDEGMEVTFKQVSPAVRDKAVNGIMNVAEQAIKTLQGDQVQRNDLHFSLSDR